MARRVRAAARPLQPVLMDGERVARCVESIALNAHQLCQHPDPEVRARACTILDQNRDLIRELVGEEEQE